MAQALNGKQEAIANLKVLFARHPEMFENLEDLRNTIKEVVSTPEIMMHNTKPKGNDVEVIVAKRLNDKKMGDIGIRNAGETNVVFHANKTRMSNFERLKKKAEKQNTATDGRDAHTPYIQAQSLDGRLVQKNISSVADENIIAQVMSDKYKVKLSENNKNNHLTQDVNLLKQQYQAAKATLSPKEQESLFVAERLIQHSFEQGNISPNTQEYYLENFYRNVTKEIKNGTFQIPNPYDKTPTISKKTDKGIDI